MTFTTSRSNLTREQHLARTAASALPLALLALAGVFMKDAVLMMQIIRTDAAASVVWTLWAVPVVMLACAATTSVIAAMRAAPRYRAKPARSRPVSMPRTAAFS